MSPLPESFCRNVQPISEALAKSTAKLADSYRAIVRLIGAEPGLIGETGRLAAGVLTAIVTKWPAIDRATLSSAWHAFQASPDVFATAGAVREFAQIVRKAKGTPASPDGTKLLKRLEAAIRAVLSAGVRPVEVKLLVARLCPKAETKPQEQPQAVAA